MDFSICFWDKRVYQLHHLGKFVAGEGLEPSIFNSKILTCLPRSNCASWLQIALRMLTTVIFFYFTIRPNCWEIEIWTQDLYIISVAF